MFIMKKVVILILALLLVPRAISQTYDDYQDITLDFKIGSELFVTSNGGRLDSLRVVLKLFPVEDSRQQIIGLETIANPEAKITVNGNYEYLWKGLYPKYEYGISSKVRVRNDLIKIKSKIRFPAEIDAEFDEYLGEGNFIDFDNEIKRQANEIVRGEDDYYMVVFKIADWIQNNVEYDLNTITAKAVQKSSWVLQNRQGVCDELTNLFISMLRMIGIPARFVTGTVYGGEGIGWGNHGWAEVYFPGKGWLPWDVTFGQHGWVDPSHLKLSDTVDSGESSVEYSWKSVNVDVQAGDLDLVTRVENTGEKFPNLARLDIKPLKDKLRFGSYFPIEVIVENKQDFYVATTLFLSRGPNVEDNSLAVLLAPNEVRSVFWISKVPDDLDEKFVYTSELEVKDSFNSVARGKIFYAKTGDFFSEEEVLDITDSLSKRNEKEPFVDVDVDCSYEERGYRSDERVKINCEVFNRGTSFIANVNVCLDNDCTLESFGIGERKSFEYELFARDSFIFVVENENFVKKETLELDVIKVPEIYITDIFPENVGYDVETEVTFDVNSDFKAKDVVLDIENIGIIEFIELEGKKPVQFSVNSKRLVSGLKIKIKYKDEGEEGYFIERVYPLIVEDVPFFARFWNKVRSWF